MTNEEAIDFGEMFLEVNVDSKNSSTYKFIDKAVKLFKQQPKWIPVSERLPEKDGAYLVTVSSFCKIPPYIEVLRFAADLHKVCAYDFPDHKSGFYDYDNEWGYFEADDAIAWMPLPEPYKEEGEKDEDK